MSMTSSLPARPTQPGANLIDRLNALRRRLGLMLWTGIGLFAAFVLAAILWPPTYTSTGTILIEQQELPPDLVRSTISSYADQRLEVIKQRVMTTDNLFGIIQKYDLYAKLRRKEVREVVIDKMRDDIHFNLISADVMDPRFGHPTKATIAFTVAYSNERPELAAKVANELVSLFLQENVENRKKRAADATSFLSDEADRLLKHIDEVQKQLAAFKEQHLNDLPDMTTVNVQLMNQNYEDIRDVNTQIRSLDQQVIYLDGQLTQISPTSQVYTSTGERVLSPQDRLKYLRTEYARVSAIYAPTHPDVIRLKREITGLENDVGSVDKVNDLKRQLQDANTKLASAEEHYEPDYPDVVQLKRLVQSLTEQIAAADKAPDVPKTKAEPDNPAYIQLSAQREAAASQRASLQTKLAELQARRQDLEKRLEKSPGVERDYMEMARELDSTQTKYREVRQKEMEAQVAQNLEDERKGERFTLIEPPLVPEKPASPNRILIIVLGAVLSIGGAVGLGLMLDSVDASVRNRRDLEALLGIPPLAVLPWFESAAERRLRKRRRRYSIAGAVGALVLCAALIHFFYRPLDVLWEVALRRFG